MRVYAVANQKGGVGKTTTAVSLAGLTAAREEATLLVDLDPHGSLTTYFGLDPDTLEDTAFRLFEREGRGARAPLAALIRPTHVPSLYLLPASSAMVTLDRLVAGKEGMGLALSRALAQCRSRFAHTFIDCPPTFGVLMLNAMAACELLLVPVQTEHLALKGLERLNHTLSMLERSRGHALDRLIVPTMFDRRTRASRDTLHTLRASYGDKLWPGMVPVDTRFREASRRGQPLTTLDPESRGALAYERLLRYLDRRQRPAAAPSPRRAAGLAM